MFKSIQNICTINSKIRKLLNSKKNETCYLFGDGPSIKYYNLRAFKGHESILVGKVFLHKEYYELNVNNIIYIEPYSFAPKSFQPEYMHELKSFTQLFKKFIKSNPKVNFFINLSNIFSISGKNIFFIHRLIPILKNSLINNNIPGPFFGGSLDAGILIAYLLGYKKIFLIGFDAWTFDQSQNLRWVEHGKGVSVKNLNPNKFFFKQMQKYIEIVVVTPGSEISPVLPSISYKELTGYDPFYRENTEIISTKDLQILNQSSDYNCNI